MRGSAVFIWDDRALFVGDRSETAVHSHHAVELPFTRSPVHAAEHAAEAFICLPRG